MKNSENIKNKIKSKGYWRVIIRPSKEFYCKDRFNIKSLVKLIEKSYVRLRGWPYPYFDNSKIAIGMDRILSYCDFMDGIIEYWEFTTSGQFSHIFAMDEDYIIDFQKAEEIKSRFPFDKSDKDKISKIDKFLDIISTVYKITEIFKFAANLAQQEEYEEVDRFEVIIQLYDVRNRMLFIWDLSRRLFSPYICEMDENKISFDDLYEKEKLISNFAPFALEIAIKIFHCFNWTNPSRQVLEEEQKKLLERRL